MSDEHLPVDGPESDPRLEPGNTITRQDDLPTQFTDRHATHILWRDGDYELVNSAGIDPEHPDLEPIPEGMDIHCLAPDPATRTVTEDLGPLKLQMQATVDTAAGAFRCRFITDIPGQEMTYLRKEQEARDRAAGGAGPWPVLEDQSAATARDLDLIAAEVIAQADAWLTLGAAIEAQRMAAKGTIAAATSAAAIRAAAIVDWDSLIPSGSGE